MKKYYLRFATALLACASLAMTSCSDSEEEDPLPQPNFPTLIEAAVSSEEPYTFTVTPNMDWEVSIPTTGEDAAWFYIQDGEAQVYKVRGSANESQAITIAVKGADEFDTDRVCRVSMTMNNQTKEIAVLTRYRLQRVFEAFVAQRATGDDAEWTLFAQDESGNYLYEAEATTSMELRTLADEFNYMQRFKVSANFPWVIAEAPEWLTFTGDVTSGEIGTTALFVMEDLEKHPFKETTGTILFKDVTDSQNPVDAGSISISIPGCENYIRTTMAATELFNAEGGYYYANGGYFGESETGVYKSFEAAYGSEIFFVVGDADGRLSIGDSSSWIRFESEMSWDEAAKEAGIWSFNRIIRCSSNTGEARTAYLIAIPRGKAEGFSQSDVIDGDKIAEAYAGYVASTISQNGAAGDFVAIAEGDVGDTSMFSFSQLPTSDWPFEGSWSSVPEGYNLTFKSELSWEHAPLKFNGTYASYEVYGEEGPYGTPMENPWVELVDNEYVEGTKNVRIAGSYNDATGTWDWACERPVNTTAYFAFKDDQGKVIALLEFILEESSEEGGEVLALYGDNPSIELKQIYEGDADFDPDTTCPQYKMTFTDYNTIQANIVVDYDAVQYSEGGVSIMNAGQYKILMFEFENEGDTGLIILTKGGVPVCCIYTEYQPGGGSGDDDEVSIVGSSSTVFLTKLTADDADYESDMDCPQYKLTFTDYDEYYVTLNLPAFDSSDTWIDDSDKVNLQGKMVLNYMESPGKAEIVLKKDGLIVCRIVVEYQPA